MGCVWGVATLGRGRHAERGALAAAAAGAGRLPRAETEEVVRELREGGRPWLGCEREAGGGWLVMRRAKALTAPAAGLLHTPVEGAAGGPV